MTPILTVLWIICGTTLLICSVMIYKILTDCKQRALRRKRQQELYDGRTSITGSTTLGGGVGGTDSISDGNMCTCDGALDTPEQ